MHPELLNHPYFTRYYQQWQERPESTAFVGVADLLCAYHYYDDARRVCEIGLQHNPKLISGRLVYARVLKASGNNELAAAELRTILAQDGKHREAQRLLREVAPMPFVEESAIPPVKPAATESQSGMQTITMAHLYAMQGHYGEARKIYQKIAEAEPDNQEVQDALAKLARQKKADSDVATKH